MAKENTGIDILSISQGMHRFNAVTLLHTEDMPTLLFRATYLHQSGISVNKTKLFHQGKIIVSEFY